MRNEKGNSTIAMGMMFFVVAVITVLIIIFIERQFNALAEFPVLSR